MNNIDRYPHQIIYPVAMCENPLVVIAVAEAQISERTFNNVFGVYADQFLDEGLFAVVLARDGTRAEALDVNHVII